MLYINQNLHPYYKLLWSKSKQLHAMKQIHSYYVFNRTIKAKIEENSRPFSITHAVDFDKYFPGIDLNSPILDVLILLYLMFMTLGCLLVNFGIFIYKSCVSFKYAFSILHLFSRQNLFVCNYHAPSCRFPHELINYIFYLGIINFEKNMFLLLKFGKNMFFFFNF